MLTLVAAVFAFGATYWWLSPDTRPLHRPSEVVGVRTAAYPEGPPAPELLRTDLDAAALFAGLPDPIPQPLDQPANCQLGSITTLVLRDGTTIDYGPCARPDAIDAFRCFIAGRPAGCA